MWKWWNPWADFAPWTQRGIGYWGAKSNGTKIKKVHIEEKKTGGDNHEEFNLFKTIVKLKRVIKGKVFKMLNLFSYKITKWIWK